MKKSILSLLVVGFFVAAALSSCETQGCLDGAPTPKKEVCINSSSSSSDTASNSSRVLDEGTLTDVSEIKTDEDAALAFAFIEENQCVVLTDKANGDIDYTFYEVQQTGTFHAKCVFKQAKPDLQMAQNVISTIRQRGSIKITRLNGVYIVQ
ncbi:hypothetical protein SAMN05421780_109131 [Flexibacter flexilis DSM 6793]|uniref:Lipoprotein n=1 Tax=Flexibacter flexilis DSM 6793 TaxID=927664 RepID=A0A1I1LZY1_9BACT|nr:hypothetical protein [Flexibacter flexilis]SFC76508.1 hypothetical protein SAMN05421780_109131 [Flexibacter flexilis DSM 6793]